MLPINPIQDTDLHKLSIYLRFVLKRMNIETPSKVDISDKVILSKLQTDKEGEHTILLDGEGELDIKVSGGRGHQEEKEYLSVIIERLNEKFQTDFKETAKVATEHITNNLKNNKKLKKRAKANPLEDFKISAKKEFKQEVVKSYSENTEFYGRILNDEEFRDKLFEYILMDLYKSLNEEE